MSGIRLKLALGFAAVLLVMIVVGGLALNRLRVYSTTLQTVFSENYDSVVYGQSILSEAAKLREGVADAAARTATVARIQENVTLAAGNITLDEEPPVIEELRSAFHDYKLAGLTGTDAEAEAALDRVSAAADEVVTLNLNNIAGVEGAVQRTASEARVILYGLLGGGVLLATLVVALMSRAILRPLRTITDSAREIERGNLDLSVPVRGRDELAQLAEAFNAMAARLREFRRTDQAKLQRAQRTTELTVNALPDAVALVTPDGTIELANDTARRLFRLYPGQRLGGSPVETLEPLRQRALRDGRPVEAEGYDEAVQLFDPPENGSERFFLPSALPIGEGEGTVVVLADVTHLRKLDEMKSGLLGVASHELKTPLTGLRMAVHLLLEEKVGPLNDKQGELVAAARDDAERLHSIITDLLDLGRMQGGRAKLDLESTRPDTLLSDAADHHRAAFAEDGIELETEVEGVLPKVDVDADRLRHAFDNLLNNARRFTPRGGTVRLTASQQDDRVRFAVSDTGPGVAESDRHKLFERFYRAPGQSDHSGAGLGLAIVKEIVEAHGGEVGVDAAAGQGATFWFTLPVSQGNHA